MSAGQGVFSSFFGFRHVVSNHCPARASKAETSHANQPHGIYFGRGSRCRRLRGGCRRLARLVCMALQPGLEITETGKVNVSMLGGRIESTMVE